MCMSHTPDRKRPDIVHAGHLKHLATSLPAAAPARAVPVVYTLHDYWLMCPRGQFIHTFPQDPDDLWAVCKASKSASAPRAATPDISAATRGSSKGTPPSGRRRSNVARGRCTRRPSWVDLFVAPWRYLHDRYRDGFGLPALKLAFLYYGFDLSRLQGRLRPLGEAFTFGYNGTQIPAKDIHDPILPSSWRRRR